MFAPRFMERAILATPGGKRCPGLWGGADTGSQAEVGPDGCQRRGQLQGPIAGAKCRDQSPGPVTGAGYRGQASGRDIGERRRVRVGRWIEGKPRSGPQSRWEVNEMAAKKKAAKKAAKKTAKKK